VHEYYSESIPISVFPTYNISDQIYSITINQIEYLSTELTISDGRIDLLIDNEGIINEFFTIQVDAITFIAGNPVDASENNVVKTMLFDLEAPTFSPLFIEEIDVGLVDIDWTTRIINLDDNSGLPVTLEELEDYVMYDTLGTYQVTLRATDATGNETLNTFDVIVSDLTSPVVTINGGAMTLQLGDTYIELGATYTDNYDEPGDAVISGDTVDTSTLGVYNVSYTYTDTSGNQSVEMSRTVTVIDTTAPVITLTGGDTIYIEVGESYTELGAMYTDNDGTAGDAIVSGDTVDTDTVGNYVVEYDIEDTNGNSAATVSRTIIVQDTVDPVVSGVTDNEVYEKGSEVTITFNEGTALLNGQAFTSGTTVSEPGEYTLVVSDGSGNVTTTTFTIEEGSNVLAIVLVIVGLMAIGAGVYIVKKFIFDK